MTCSGFFAIRYFTCNSSQNSNCWGCTDCNWIQKTSEVLHLPVNNLSIKVTNYLFAVKFLPTKFLRLNLFTLLPAGCMLKCMHSIASSYERLKNSQPQSIAYLHLVMVYTHWSFTNFLCSFILIGFCNAIVFKQRRTRRTIMYVLLAWFLGYHV